MMGPDAKQCGAAVGFGPVGGAQHFLPKGLSRARPSHTALGPTEQSAGETRGLSSLITCRIFIHSFIYFEKLPAESFIDVLMHFSQRQYKHRAA